MTQAVNLANFANYLDTGGGMSPSALNAPTPISKGGTGGTTASDARTNLGLVIGTNVPSPTGTGASGTWPISISGNAATATSATTATTAANGGVTSVNGMTGAVTVSAGVTSFIGQTGAVDPTVYGSIGSICQVFNLTTSSLAPNSTIAGSNLAVITGGSAPGGQQSQFILVGSWGTNGNVTMTTWGGFIFGALTRFTNGNVGYQSPVGTNCSTLSGTWRILTPNAARAYGYDGCGNLTQSYTFGCLAVRIS